MASSATESPTHNHIHDVPLTPLPPSGPWRALLVLPILTRLRVTLVLEAGEAPLRKRAAGGIASQGTLRPKSMSRWICHFAVNTMEPHLRTACTASGLPGLFDT